MKELFQRELEKADAFSGKLPEILVDLAGAINNYRIPEKMKLAIAVSEFVLFFSQFQNKIKMPDKALIPINIITFCIAGSGAGKDSSKDAIRACFGEAYATLNTERKKIAKQRAIEKARAEGLENPTAFEVYKEYYVAPNPLFSAPDSTLEGLTSDFNRLEEEKLGAGFIYSGEIGDEFSKGIDDLMQFMSEVYDKGQKEVKALKGKENQLKPLHNFPVSSLFMGSQAGILFEPEIKHKFRKSFSSKLARRCFFQFAPEEIKKPNFTDIKQFDKWTAKCKMDAYDSKVRAIAAINKITERLINNMNVELELSEEVERLYDRYMAYNEEVSEEIDHHLPISRLARKHYQWKALKFAGALAMFNGHDKIEADDYINAISYCETLTADLMHFEGELSKQPHEVFADFMNTTANIDGRNHMSFHTISKLGYIKSGGTTDQRIKELIKLAASYDKQGIYVMCEEGICFEKQKLTEIINISYLPIDNTELFAAIEKNADKDEIDIIKHRIASKTTYGYEEYDTTFEELGEMLAGDYAYTPFKLRQANKDAVYDKNKHKDAKGGVRGKDNIVGGCKWIVMDIDNSVLTAKEVHVMLSDINHHIALTSNKHNEYKFRILIELDSVVDIPDIQWKNFIGLISESLAINTDPLPKGQIFFSYSGSPVYSIIDAEPLCAKPFIIESAEMVASKERLKKAISPSENKAALNSPLNTFFYAYEAADGEGSRSLIRAAMHAKDLGADKNTVIQLMYDINDYWAYSMPMERFERTIIGFVERLF